MIPTISVLLDRSKVSINPDKQLLSSLFITLSAFEESKKHIKEMLSPFFIMFKRSLIWLSIYQISIKKDKQMLSSLSIKLSHYKENNKHYKGMLSPFLVVFKRLSILLSIFQ